MSEETPEAAPTPEWLDGVVIETADEEVFKPQSPTGATEAETPTEPRPLTAAERVRDRLRQARGSAASEPSISPGTPRASRKERKEAPPKPREGSLVKPLTDLYTTVGMMLAPFDPACSVAFIDNAHSCAVAMEKLARENESIRRVILALTQTSAWGGALIAHMPIILVIMMHHGPPQVAERVAPLAFLMNPSTMQRAAEADKEAQDTVRDEQNGISDVA